MITDYNKGFVSERMYKEIINICKLNNIKTFFDPNVNNKFDFTNVDFIKLNLSEAYDISSTNSIDESLKYFERKKITPIITQSSDGAVSLINNRTIKVNAREIKAVDVSGCGDVFFAVFVSYYLSNTDVEISINSVGKKQLNMLSILEISKIDN
jgi:bifunctional ADP-heptose synthase (sugar kinase/adenylyltransferase)